MISLIRYPSLAALSNHLRNALFASALILLLMGFSGTVVAQDMGVIPSHEEAVSISSGMHEGMHTDESEEGHVIGFRRIIRSSGAEWLRLHFSDYDLGEESYITITSLEDGGRQRLDASAIKQWNGGSAFFNGEAVEIALHVAPSDSSMFFNIEELLVGEKADPKGNVGKSNSTLACTDNRSLANPNHPAVSRGIYYSADKDGPVRTATQYVGSNGSMLSAGHALDPAHEPLMVEFNVPDSDSNGNVDFSDPSDQYSFDTNSIVYEYDPHDGNKVGGSDWAIFSVFPNSNTGLLPLEAQDAFFRLSHGPKLSWGDPVRVTGYGNDTGTVGHKSQQTRTGDYNYELVDGDSNDVFHVAHIYVETNDSGSPFIDEDESVDVSKGIVTTSFLGKPCSTLVTSFEEDDLATAVNDFPGSDVVYVDANHPTPSEDGSAFKPYDTINEGFNNVSSGGIVSVVEGSFSGTSITVNSSLTLETTGNPADIDIGDISVTSGNKLTIRGRGFTLGGNKIDVASGATLSIEDGVEILLDGSGELWTEGDLNINGTDSRPVKFAKASGASNWKYIYLYGTGTSGSSINHLEISGSDYGIHTNNAGSLTIDNLAAVTNYYNGLKLYNTTNSTPTISSSLFSNQTNQGVYIESSNGEFLDGNSFEENGKAGLKIRSSSTVYGGDYNETADIKSQANTTYGISVAGNSYTSIGVDAGDFGGNNSVHSNGTGDARVNNGGELYAENTYWGESPPSSGDFSVCTGCTFDYQPYLSSNPGLSVEPYASGSAPEDQPIARSGKTYEDIDTSTPARLVRSIRDMVVQSGNAEALNALGDLRSHADPAIAEAARRLRVQLLLNSGYTSEGISYGEQLLARNNANPTTDRFVSKLLFYYYLLEQGDAAKAEEMYGQLQLLEDTDVTNGLLAKVFEGHTGDNLLAAKTVSTGREEIPTRFTLGNYPNPFNPSTEIRYTLPERTRVQLTVYSVMGRKVAELVNESQTAGQYSVSFEATGLASGIYLYRLETGIETLNETMLLVK